MEGVNICDALKMNAQTVLCYKSPIENKNKIFVFVDQY